MSKEPETMWTPFGEETTGVTALGWRRNPVARLHIPHANCFVQRVPCPERSDQMEDEMAINFTD